MVAAVHGDRYNGGLWRQSHRFYPGENHHDSLDVPWNLLHECFSGALRCVCRNVANSSVLAVSKVQCVHTLVWTKRAWRGALTLCLCAMLARVRRKSLGGNYKQCGFNSGAEFACQFTLHDNRSLVPMFCGLSERRHPEARCWAAAAGQEIHQLNHWIQSL